MSTQFVLNAAAKRCVWNKHLKWSVHRARLKHITAGCSKGWEQARQRLSHTLFLDMTEEQTKGSNNSKTNNTLLNLNLIWKVRGSQWKEARTDMVPLSLPSEELCCHIFNLLNLVHPKMQRVAVIQTSCWKYMNYILNSTSGRCTFTFPRSHNQKKRLTVLNCCCQILKGFFFFFFREEHL